jgi:WD40 repeat protein
VATGSSDSTVKVWDGAQGTLQATLRGGNGNVIIACDISNGIVVGGGTDKTCRVWNARTERMVSGREGGLLLKMTNARFIQIFMPSTLFLLERYTNWWVTRTKLPVCDYSEMNAV